MGSFIRITASNANHLLHLLDPQADFSIPTCLKQHEPLFLKQFEEALEIYKGVLVPHYHLCEDRFEVRDVFFEFWAGFVSKVTSEILKVTSFSLEEFSNLVEQLSEEENLSEFQKMMNAYFINAFIFDYPLASQALLSPIGLHPSYFEKALETKNILKMTWVLGSFTSNLKQSKDIKSLEHLKECLFSDKAWINAVFSQYFETYDTCVEQLRKSKKMSGNFDEFCTLISGSKYKEHLFIDLLQSLFPVEFFKLVKDNGHFIKSKHYEMLVDSIDWMTLEFIQDRSKEETIKAAEFKEWLKIIHQFPLDLKEKILDQLQETLEDSQRSFWLEIAND